MLIVWFASLCSLSFWAARARARRVAGVGWPSVPRVAVTWAARGPMRHCFYGADLQRFAANVRAHTQFFFRSRTFSSLLDVFLGQGPTTPPMVAKTRRMIVSGFGRATPPARQRCGLCTIHDRNHLFLPTRHWGSSACNRAAALLPHNNSTTHHR